ncbi:hypothetical protein PCH_Pc21g03620 [Penicillium rubens Wisconsin 54-1255]|uniref:Uncharacterized protein n=1 Tax=Penicillium rubens (strain ATCC 28089 / DSM 1075 / NRRL 1951 / Wisconsin 54-1255) TaxID=500485 RepID=B6HLH7_PENRW|nr:hypothetical protein PCH_Pc21g03620 [Penicillium rubens Wisconsin 54-1255]
MSDHSPPAPQPAPPPQNAASRHPTSPQTAQGSVSAPQVDNPVRNPDGLSQRLQSYFGPVRHLLLVPPDFRRRTPRGCRKRGYSRGPAVGLPSGVGRSLNQVRIYRTVESRLLIARSSSERRSCGTPSRTLSMIGSSNMARAQS